jgi:Flp pilus assembly protein TadG
MPCRARSDRGQATVELALALPFVCLVVLGVVQVGVLVRDRLVVHEAARSAARSAAVAATVAAVSPAGDSSSGQAGGAGRIRVTLRTDGGDVVATATYVDPTDVPLIGALLPDVTLSDSVAMPAEPP